MTRYLIVILALAILASFTWALKRHFRAPDGTPFGMKALTAASTGAALHFIVLTLRDGVGFSAGLAFAIASLAGAGLFWWAIETTRRRPPHVAHSGKGPDMIYDRGPYAYVRHPFYLAYCLFWLGTALAVGGLQWPVAALLIAWYYATARMEERDFLRSPMAHSYTEYRGRTGMIVPRLMEMRRR